MADRFVIIKHRDGREFAIRPSDFTKGNTDPGGESYAERGFRIDRWEDGTPYDGPKTAREIERQHEQRVEAAQAAASKDEPKGRKAD